MRLYSLVFCLFSIMPLPAQHFYKTYDLDKNEYQSGRSLHVVDDGILIVGNAVRGGDQITFITKIDLAGDTLWTKKYPEFYGFTRKTTLHDSILYFPYAYYNDDGVPEIDGYRLCSFNMNGDSITSSKFDLSNYDNPPVDSIRKYSAYGSIFHDNKIVVYGDIYEAGHEITTNVFNRGLVVWYNLDLSLDTMIIIQPRFEDLFIWDADISSDGYLTFLINDDIYLNGRETHFRRFEKYDNNATKVWQSEPLELIHPYFLFLPMAALSNGDMIMYYDDSSIEEESKMLVSVSENGHTNWISKLDPNFDLDYRNILEIEEAHDGHILIAGEYTSLLDREGSYLAKINNLTGELLWERVYQSWVPDDFDQRTEYPAVWQMVSQDNGDIIMVGEHRKYLDDGFDRDLLLMIVDDNGCIEEDCGGFEQDVSGTPNYYHLFQRQSLWFHQDPEAEGGLYKIDYPIGSTTDRNVFQLARNWRNLDPKEPSGGWLSNIEYFRIENNGYQVYYTDPVTEQNQLLYDFTLDVSDTFSSTYLDQDLTVINSDTIRLLDGDKRRTWTLACEDNPEHTLTWIERIGTDYGVIWPRDFCSGDYGDVRLTCYYDFERLAYINDEIGGCFVSSTQDDPGGPTTLITATPNPTQDRLTLTAPRDLHITRTDLLDTQGRTHTQHYTHTSEVMLDLGSYPAGLYFVSVYTDRGNVVKKIVKN